MHISLYDFIVLDVQHCHYYLSFQFVLSLLLQYISTNCLF